MGRTNHRGHGGRTSIGRSRVSLKGVTIVCLFLSGFLCVLCGEIKPAQTQTSDLALPQEKHFRNVRQLTFGGENAEAYFSPDGTKLIYQATAGGAACDQEYILDLATGDTRRVSSGKGRTTCGYFAYPKGDRIIYSSTEADGPDCPPAPDR